MKVSSHTKKEGLDASPGTQNFTELYYDKQDMLQKFNVSSRTLQRWRSDNVVAFTKIGGKYFYPKEELEKAIANGTIQAKLKSDSAEIIQETNVPEKTNIPSDTFPFLSNNPKQSASFAGVWDPIPGYLVPILTIIIYLSPYADDLISGRPIIPFVLLVPLEVASVGCAAYLLLQLGIKISRKFTGIKKIP